MTITQVEAINHLQNKSNFSVETKMINNIIKASFSNNFIFFRDENIFEGIFPKFACLNRFTFLTYICKMKTFIWLQIQKIKLFILKK